ncbi:MAG: hypothetical protein KKC51_12715 [Verrucomicrobia bacterium]|nr:hypothetical protein [Verrucomicrobiota bacterium]
MLLNPMVLPVTIPVIAGFLCLLLPKALDRVRGFVAVVAAALTLVAVWPVFRGGNQVADLAGWVSLRIDGLSAFVLLATAVFGLLITVYSVGFMKGKARLREYYAYVLWTLGASLGAVMANDLVLLLILWGFLGITLYLLIGIAGPDAADAAKKSFIIIGGSDCILMLGVVLVWVKTGSTRMDGPAMALGSRVAYVAFLSFVAAAFAKAGAMPLHSWVPDCGEKAPVPVAALLPASLDKLLGIYLLVRVVVDLFTLDGLMKGLLMLIGAVTVLFAVMMALVQHDMKRLLSYHAVSQVGYMVLGIASGTAVGIAGGLFHMLNNAIYKSALFLCAGAVEKQTGTTDLDRLGGLGKAMPLTFAAFVVAALSISGIPPLNGFASKWMVYQGIIEGGRGGRLWVIWLVAAMLGSALTLASFVKVLHAAFLRKASPDVARKNVREVGFTMWLPTTILAATCVAFGVLVHHLPLPYLIRPAIGASVDFTGVWGAGPATVMLLAGIALGLVLYFLTSARKVRTCQPYIGGEVMSEPYIQGVARGPSRDVEVTGVDFYQTIQDLPLIHKMYDLAAKKVFDIYDVGRGTAMYFIEALRKAHAGLLPVYLTWVMAGLLVILYMLMRLWG